MSALLARLHARATGAAPSRQRTSCWPFDDAAASPLAGLPPRLLPPLHSLARDAATAALLRGCVVLGWTQDGAFLVAHVLARRRSAPHKVVLLAVDADGCGPRATVAATVPLFRWRDQEGDGGGGASGDEGGGGGSDSDDDAPSLSPSSSRLTGGLAVTVHQAAGLLCVYGADADAADADGGDCPATRVALTIVPLPPPRSVGWRLTPVHAAYVADAGRPPAPPVGEGGAAIVPCAGAEGVDVLRVRAVIDRDCTAAALITSTTSFDAARFASAALAPAHRLADLGVALAGVAGGGAVAVVVARAAGGGDAVLLASLADDDNTITPLAALPPPPASAAAPAAAVADAVAAALAARWRLNRGDTPGLTNAAAVRGASLEWLRAPGAPLGVRL